MSKENGSELAEIPPQQLRVQSTGDAFSEAFGRGPAGELASFKLDSPEGRYLSQKCAEAPDEGLSNMVGQTILVRHVYAHRIELPHPESGELVPCLRVCLITPENAVHACVSDGVRLSVGRLIGGHKMPPWEPPLKVTVRQQRTKNKHIRMFLWDESAVEPTKGKK